MPKKELDEYYWDGYADGKAGRPKDLPFQLDLISGIIDDLGGKIETQFEKEANKSYKRGYEDGRKGK